MELKHYKEIECQIFWDGDRDSFESVRIAFDADSWDSENQSEFHEEYFYHLTHEELSSLLKDIKVGHNVWNIAHSEWAIDLCEDYEIVSHSQTVTVISTGVSI